MRAVAHLLPPYALSPKLSHQRCEGMGNLGSIGRCSIEALYIHTGAMMPAMAANAAAVLERQFLGSEYLQKRRVGHAERPYQAAQRASASNKGKRLHAVVKYCGLFFSPAAMPRGLNPLTDSASWDSVPSLVKALPMAPSSARQA